MRGAIADNLNDAIELRIENDLLWLSTRDASLEAAFHALEKTAGYRLYVLGELTERITIDIAGVPLARAIELLAGQRSTTITWRTDATGARRMAEVWVFGEPNFAASAALDVAPEPPSDMSLPAELTNPDPQVRAAAVEQLYGRPDEEAITILHGLVANDEARSVRAAALRTLEVIGGAAAHKAISAALADDDPGLRGDALQALVRISPDESLTYMGQLLFADRDPGVRRQAAELLSRSEHPAARAILDQATNYYDEAVREAANSVSRPPRAR